MWIDLSTVVVMCGLMSQVVVSVTKTLESSRTGMKVYVSVDVTFDVLNITKVTCGLFLLMLWYCVD